MRQLLDKFSDGLEEGENDNATCNLKKPNSNQHQLKLTSTHCHVRWPEVVLPNIDQIKEAAQLLEEKIVKMLDNIADQSQSGTGIEYASLFDFNNQVDNKKPIEYFKELHAIYSISYKHTDPQNENDDLDFRKHNTTIKIMYEGKIPKQIKKRQSGPTLITGEHLKCLKLHSSNQNLEKHTKWP